VLLLAGCGGHALSGAERAQQAPPVRVTRIAGATPREGRVLRALLAAMRPTRISSVAVERIARGIRLRVHAGASLRGEWEANLLADRYAAEADRLGLRPVALATLLPHSTVAIASVRREVRAAIGRGTRIVELRDEGDGVALVVRVPDPAGFLVRHGPALAAIFVTRPHFVGVEDRHGDIVYAWGGVPNAGMVYARPDLDACGPIHHSVAVGYRADPCPAR
jgi:hypothetical protein